MRKANVIKGDMIFQWKYGFYMLYFIIIVIYLVLFSFLNGSVKNTIVSICIYSDPAAMGMFFMGGTDSFGEKSANHSFHCRFSGDFKRIHIGEDFVNRNYF